MECEGDRWHPTAPFCSLFPPHSTLHKNLPNFIMESTSSGAEASNPKRPAADRPSGGCDDPPVTKRPRTATTPVAIDAAALVMAHKKIAELEATVIGAKAREAAQGQRIAALEADNAWLRKRQRLPEPPAALQQLVQALGMREPDLRDLVFKMACIPRYLARCAQRTPRDVCCDHTDGDHRGHRGWLQGMQQSCAGDATAHRDGRVRLQRVHFLERDCSRAAWSR